MCVKSTKPCASKLVGGQRFFASHARDEDGTHYLTGNPHEALACTGGVSVPEGFLAVQVHYTRCGSTVSEVTVEEAPARPLTSEEE